ncbi:MAG: DUF3267 domain-containing protein [Phycisphaerales bacterium]
MIIPGQVISVATFPGVIVHEAAHMLFCELRGVAVLDVRFFRLGNPAGYVVHEPPGSFTTAFLISFGPFLVNSLLCMLICFPAFLPLRVFGINHPFSYVLLWLGVSIGMHAFPSIGDAQSVLAQAKKEASSLNLLAILSYPLVWAVYVANILRFFWLDYLYGIGIGLGLPALIF